jgi:hypothetical protein
VATSPSERISAYIDELGDWRGEMLAELRRLIRAAAPELVEDWKWNTPVWSQNGNVLAVGAFRDHVKVNMFRGASLADRKGLFNAGLDAKASRAIDLHRRDAMDAEAFKELVREAAETDRRMGGGKRRGTTR